MAHARKQIRDAVATALTGLATTGENVFTTRTYSEDSLPCIRIWTGPDAEDTSMSDMDGQGFELQLEIDALADAADEDIQDTLDTICAEVHVALRSDADLLAIVTNLRLQSIEPAIEGEEAEKAVGRARMTWYCLYRIDEDNPNNLA